MQNKHHDERDLTKKSRSVYVTGSVDGEKIPIRNRIRIVICKRYNSKLAIEKAENFTFICFFLIWLS
jgi:hypothetical protein